MFVVYFTWEEKELFKIHVNLFYNTMKHHWGKKNCCFKFSNAIFPFTLSCYECNLQLIEGMYFSILYGMIWENSILENNIL